MRNKKIFLSGLVLAAAMQASVALAADGTTARITPALESVEVMHNGAKVVISRTQDKDARIPEVYAKTSRGCPPFCVQPMEAVPGVATVGELEVLGYLKRIAGGDASIIVIDSRTPEWAARGTIPGSVNIPWDTINHDVEGMFAVEAEAETMASTMSEQFGAKQTADGWDFSGAKTLVMYCNGIWCPQSAINLRTLAKIGYPVSKLKWYRGGMQDWVSVGLTTVKP